MKKLVIASHNAGKVSEIRHLLTPLGINVLSAGELALQEPEENGASFAENAVIKSRAAALAAGEYALSDDSGLCIAALDNAPGIYSARWAGPMKDFALAAHKIQAELLKKNCEMTGQKAFFSCVLALSAPDGSTEIFEGRVEGTLVFPPRGTKGFGYDSIFIPEGDNRSFAEMEEAEKHTISHRARAFMKCLDYLKGRK